MTASAEDRDRHTEPMLAEVDKILTAIETNYGLNRAEAVGCIRDMALALEEYRPGDDALKEEFYKGVEMSAGSFEDWALKVGRNVIGWRDHS